MCYGGAIARQTVANKPKIMPKPNSGADLARRKKILIVDDNEIILKTISFKLREAGYDPVVALDGSEAMALVRRDTPDLILLDINFPPDVFGEPWDGFRILDRMRQQERLRDIPVIIISSSEQEADRERALRSGTTAFFRKPIDHVDLLKVIRENTGDGAPSPRQKRA